MKASKRLKWRIWILFSNKYMRVGHIDNFILFGLATWIFEWTYVLNSVVNYWSFSRFIFPFRTPFMLMLVFSYWVYVWGISVWRRTQYGKFTRGDRKLWAKGFASFWVSEFSTIAGIFAAICWMSWGPIAIIPRIFFVPKKNFLIELTIFSYVVWIIYIMRLSIKWQLWKTQYILTWTIVVILSYLIWRDFILLYSREVVTVNQGARWRYLKSGSIVYSLNNYWWLKHYYGPGRHIETPFMPMSSLIELNFLSNPFATLNLNTEYDRYTRMPLVKPNEWVLNALPWKDYSWAKGFFNMKIWKSPIYEFKTFDSNSLFCHNSGYKFPLPLDSWIAHPRRYGFMPKKISMWYFLIYLKIWHHLILFIWWFLLLIRLHGRKKTSFSFLSSCYFNVYCCFLIGLLVYIYQYLKYWETIFKFRPARAPFIFKARWHNTMLYYWDIISDGIYFWRRPKHSLLTKYYDFSKYFDLAYIHKDELNVKSDIVYIKFNLSVDKMFMKINDVNNIMNIEEKDIYSIHNLWILHVCFKDCIGGISRF